MRLTALLLVLVAVVVAGCTLLGGPDAQVVDSRIQQGVIGEITGEATVIATVVNDGGAGEVAVTVTLLNGEGTVLDKFSRTVEMDENERRRVDIPINIPQGTQTYRITAQPG